MGGTLEHLARPTSMTTQFDSLEYAQRLERAGVPEDQAAVHAQVLQQALTQVVCTGQLSDSEDGSRMELQHAEERLTAKIEAVRDGLEAKIEGVRIELEAKIERVGIELDAKIDSVRISMEAKIESVRISLEAKIDVLRAELHFMRWMIGVLIAMNAGIIIKLFNL